MVMFDENQILTTEQYWETEILGNYREKAKENGNHFKLTKQMRITASDETISWIDDFTKENHLSAISDGYHRI